MRAARLIQNGARSDAPCRLFFHFPSRLKKFCTACFCRGKITCELALPPLLFFLALRGTLPRPLAALVVLYPLHLHWSLRTLAEGLTYASICRLQARYRAIYAIIGVAMVVVLWSARPAA